MVERVAAGMGALVQAETAAHVEIQYTSASCLQ